LFARSSRPVQSSSFEADGPESSARAVLVIGRPGDFLAQTSHEPRQVGETFAQFRKPFGVGREHCQVVLIGLDRLTRGIVAGRENPAPSQGDLVGKPSPGDVRSIAEHEMEMVIDHGRATNLNGEEPC
jgi:hypothetical protein